MERKVRNIPILHARESSPADCSWRNPQSTSGCPSLTEGDGPPPSDGQMYKQQKHKIHIQSEAAAKFLIWNIKFTNLQFHWKEMQLK